MPTSVLPSNRWRWQDIRLPAIGLAIAAALCVVAIAPVGYVGHGWDDEHYLAAARCAASHGFCLPHDHWERRFPLVIPAGLVLRLFGESPHTLWIVPLAYSLAAIALFTATVQRNFGRQPALIAGFLFAVMPVFSGRVLHFGIDIIECTFLIAAAYCFTRARAQRPSLWVALSGIAIAFAVLTRPTSLAMIPVAIAAYWLSGQRHRLPVFLAALAAPLLAEGALYWLATGDPLRSWRLSLAHTTIASHELPAGMDLTQSPLFNVNFIANWTPASGIKIHWTIDALVNLLVNSDMIVLPVAIGLVLLHRRHIGMPQAGGKTLPLLAAAAAFHFAILVYALAIDPKPRMFLPDMAIACAICGLLGSLSLQKGQRLLVFGIVAIMGIHACLAARDRAAALADIRPTLQARTPV